MNRENVIYKKILDIEKILKTMDSNGADVLIEENKKLQAEILELRSQNTVLKGKVTKLENKKKEVK